jgi:hypothetical protein
MSCIFQLLSSTCDEEMPVLPSVKLQVDMPYSCITVVCEPLMIKVSPSEKRKEYKSRGQSGINQPLVLV